MAGCILITVFESTENAGLLFKIQIT
uniref:Uncharacterized protein n=1 Tax=Anguilla anguilla TaxID=7936 RepID=A0A0E9VKK2_ANGAN